MSHCEAEHPTDKWVCTEPAGHTGDHVERNRHFSEYARWPNEGKPIAVPGLTLRDLFAMAALAGTAGSGIHHEALTGRAYEIADAMLAARKEGA